MEKSTKKLLGCVGLATVATMTGVAIAIPSPEASAANSASVTYTVTVREASSIVIKNADGSEISGSPVYVQAPIDFLAEYTTGDAISYTVTNTDTGASYTVGPETLSSENGKYPISLTDFSTIGGYGNYTINVKVDSTTASEDTVAFSFKAVKAEQIGTDDKGNPIVDIEKNPEVDHLGGEVYDEDGNKVGDLPEIVPDDNGEAVIDLSKIEPALPEGDYKVVITAYDKDGNIIDQYTITVHYSPVAPAVPDTGALHFGDLAISQSDLLVTVLVAFLLTAGAAFFCLRKKQQR